MNEEKKCKNSNQNHQANASNGAVYGLGLIGAAIYFISVSTSFGMGVLGFLKALIWPTILVYKALQMLGA
jgi:hypothetical protein